MAHELMTHEARLNGIPLLKTVFTDGLNRVAALGIWQAAQFQVPENSNKTFQTQMSQGISGSLLVTNPRD